MLNYRGIEPRSQAWKAYMMPLHYVCRWDTMWRTEHDAAVWNRRRAGAAWCGEGMAVWAPFMATQNAQLKNATTAR